MADFKYYVVESDGHVASRHRTIKGAEVRCSYLNNHSRGKYRVEPAPVTLLLEEKYEKAVDALIFIAFNNSPFWKDADRRSRAAKALVDLGEFKKLTP